jgi:hypothetical protein
MRSKFLYLKPNEKVKLCSFNNFILYSISYPFEVVKKLSIVVTPSIVRAGTAFHSNQNVRKEDDTRIIPEHKNRNLAHRILSTFLFVEGLFS